MRSNDGFSKHFKQSTSELLVALGGGDGATFFLDLVIDEAYKRVPCAKATPPPAPAQAPMVPLTGSYLTGWVRDQLSGLLATDERTLLPSDFSESASSSPSPARTIILTPSKKKAKRTRQVAPAPSRTHQVAPAPSLPSSPSAPASHAASAMELPPHL